jgi:hypothetical protein
VAFVAPRRYSRTGSNFGDLIHGGGGISPLADVVRQSVSITAVYVFNSPVKRLGPMRIENYREARVDQLGI